MSTIKKLFIAALILFGGAGCSSMMYYPTSIQYVEGPELEKSREIVKFKSLDGTALSGWFFKAHQPYRGTIVQFHGNAENMTSHFFSLYWLVEQGYDLFTFDYRGYGTSEGSPDQAGLNQDALAAIHYILKRQDALPAPHIILYGQSLGGAVLMRAYDDLSPSERNQIRSMVIESSFHNYHAIAANVLSRSFLTWLFQPLAYVLMSNRYGPEDSIPHISPTPLLVIHGDHDQVVPFEFGEKIFSLAHEPKQFLKVPAAGHLECLMIENGKYRKELLQFLSKGKIADENKK